jgi:ribulose 1,5-bisphosphate carboxylase large subunit-like protein
MRSKGMQDVIATCYFRPGRDINPGHAARAICDEESPGTWTDITTRADYARQLVGAVEALSPQGGGIRGHPDGTVAGARAMRQAVDAYMTGVSVQEYGKDHHGLERVLKLRGAE